MDRPESDILIAADRISRQLWVKDRLHTGRRTGEIKRVDRIGEFLPLAIVREKEEGAVLDDRSGEASAKLVDLLLRTLVRNQPLSLARFVRRRIGIQRFVAEIFKTAAVKFVCARLGHDVDDCSAGATKLRREAILVTCI